MIHNSKFRILYYGHISGSFWFMNGSCSVYQASVTFCRLSLSPPEFCDGKTSAAGVSRVKSLWIRTSFWFSLWRVCSQQTLSERLHDYISPVAAFLVLIWEAVITSMPWVIQSHWGLSYRNHLSGKRAFRTNIYRESIARENVNTVIE